MQPATNLTTQINQTIHAINQYTQSISPQLNQILIKGKEVRIESQKPSPSLANWDKSAKLSSDP